MTEQKLFADKETFKKERPTKPTAYQLEAFYKKFAAEIIREGYSNDDVESIVEDLKDTRIDKTDGYHMARDLEDYGGASYEFNSDFVTFLEDYDYQIRHLIEENEKAWVKAHDIKPVFQKGEKLSVVKGYRSYLTAGKIVFVNRVNDETAKYVVDEDPERQGGYVYNFEIIENACVKA